MLSRRSLGLCATVVAASLTSKVHAVQLWSWESGTAEGWGATKDIDSGWLTNPVTNDHVRGAFGATDGNLAYDYTTPTNPNAPTSQFGFDEATLLQASNITGVDPTQALRWDSFKNNNLLFADITVQGERTAPLDASHSHYTTIYPALNGPDQAGHFIDSYSEPVNLDTGATSPYTLAFATEYYTGARTRTMTWDYLNAGYDFNALTPTDTAQNYSFVLWAINSNTGGLQVGMDNIRLYRARTTDPTWAGSASGTWSNASSWLNAVPNAVAAVAVLNYKAGVPAATISLDSSKTVGSLVINSAARDALGTPSDNASGSPANAPTAYTITATGGATLTLNNGTDEASIVATAAGNVINAPINFNSNGVIDLTADVRTGALDGVPGQTGASLAINGNVTVAAGKTLRTTSVGSLTMNGNIIGGAGSALHIGGGHTALTGSNHRIAVSDLAVATSAQLDLGSGSATVDYTGTSPIAALTASIASGYAAGANTGNGIVTSVAGRAVGIAEASSLTLTGGAFLGQSVDGTTVVIRSTYRGDADLNGTVNFDDLVSLAQNYNKVTGGTWRLGDFNYDGAVNFDDLVPLAQNYNKSLTASETAVLGSAFAADYAFARSIVPEPAMLSSLGMLMLLRRRRA